MSSSSGASDWDQVLATWKAKGGNATVYVASLDILADADTAPAKSFHSNAWLYFNRVAPASPWSQLNSAQVVRPLRWQPVTGAATRGVQGTLLFAAVLHNDEEAKAEFDRIDNELRALATSEKCSAAFRFRVQLCKLMAQQDGGAIVAGSASPSLVIVPASWQTKHPLAAAIASIPSRVVNALHTTESHGSGIISSVSSVISGVEKKVAAGISGVDAKVEEAKAAVKTRHAEVDRIAGASFVEAIGLTPKDMALLASFVVEVESGKVPLREALAKAAQKDPELRDAVRKILAADVGGELLLPFEEAECDEAKEEKDGAILTGASAVNAANPASGTAETRRLVGSPAVPQLAVVPTSELTSRVSSTVYQWATQFLICPRIQPTTSWFTGKPNGVPAPENVSAISLFGFKGLIKVLTNPISPSRVLKLFDSFADIPVRDGIGKSYPNDWSSDSWFVRQRLEGCNASQITIVKTLPASWLPGLKQSQPILGWTDAQVATEQKKLQGLIDAKELYMVDYSSSFLAPDGVGTPLSRFNSINGEYLAAPIALFQYDRVAKTFVPYAIQVESDTARYNNTNMIYMRDPANGWMWRYAKTALTSADWNYHEIGSHLTKTHLCIEVIAVSAHRNFAEQHPLYQLLVPHFVNTMSLNFFARSTLVPDVISALSPLGLAGSLDFSSYLYNTWDFATAGAVDDLISRGFNPDTISTDLPTYYEARDALGLWKILQTFVSAIVAQSYPADTDGKNPAITADFELQAWVTELQGKLGSKGTPSQRFPDITNSVSLIKTLTTIIYTASVKHSAVNYLQDYYWSYMPNAPPFFRQKAPAASVVPVQPTDRDTFYKDYLLNSLPDKAAESGQDAVVSTLSQPAPHDSTLQGFAQSKKARRANLTEWMNAARDVLQSNLSAYDAKIVAENRPAPGYNILKSSQVATSIRI